MPHVFRERLILSAVSLIYHHHDIVALGQKRIFLPLGPTELLDQGKHETLVLAKKLAHLFTVLGLSGIAFLDRLSVKKVAINLPVQVLPIRNDNEGEVPGKLAEDFAHQKNHREALAGSLCVPKDT